VWRVRRFFLPSPRLRGEVGFLRAAKNPGEGGFSASPAMPRVPLTPNPLPASGGEGSAMRQGDISMLKFYDREFSSRLLIGQARLYPSPAIMQGAIRASGAQIVTVVAAARIGRRQDRGRVLVADPRA